MTWFFMKKCLSSNLQITSDDKLFVQAPIEIISSYSGCCWSCVNRKWYKFQQQISLLDNDVLMMTFLSDPLSWFTLIIYSYWLVLGNLMWQWKFLQFTQQIPLQWLHNDIGKSFSRTPLRHWYHLLWFIKCIIIV